MANLFAFRATDPEDMMIALDPIGPENDFWLRDLSNQTMIVIAAWGVRGAFRGRDNYVVNRILCMTDLMCLKHTKDGHPWHPLYVAGATQPIPFWRNKS